MESWRPVLLTYPDYPEVYHRWGASWGKAYAKLVLTQDLFVHLSPILKYLLSIYHMLDNMCVSIDLYMPVYTIGPLI